MNKKDILTDFCVHLLLLGDEFHNDELHFFDSREKSNANYENYVEAVNKLINVEDFIWDTDIDVPISKIERLNDLIIDKEIEFFEEYINNEFSFGYPNEINEDGFAWGGSYNLNLSAKEIESHFVDYLELRKLNPYQYITYYQQFLEHLQALFDIAIEPTIHKIDNFYNNRSSIDNLVYSELKDSFEAELKTNLLECTQKTTFQLQGGFDNYGFILNYRDTLKLILKQHSTKYSKLNLSTEPNQYCALIEYEYYLLKFERKEAVSKTEEQKILKEEFESLKQKNPEQIKFLKDKGFDYREIDIILNCFSLNRFKTTGIRNIRNTNQVDFYGLFYFFYRFEFLKKTKNLNFELEKDFLNVPLIGEISKNDFKKYYEHSDDSIILSQNYHKRYPFKNAKKLLEKIKSELHIDLKKLNIPQQLGKHL